MQTTQSLTKTQQYSITMLCQAIRRIEELVPKEEKRSSDRRKKQLIAAYLSLAHHCKKLEIVLPEQDSMLPQVYLEQVEQCASVLTARFAPTWQSCEKIMPIRVRQLRQADYEACGGVIETHEGPAPFVVGDYLADDALGAYPIRRTAIEQHYSQVTLPDEQGWAWYRSREHREARRMFRCFPTTCGVSGQAGDYHVRGSDGQTWPCAKEKFEQEYRLLPTQPDGKGGASR